MKKIAKDRKVIPDPIDDRKFQEWKESGKSGILLGITLNPRKCIGEKVRRIPINVETKCMTAGEWSFANRILHDRCIIPILSRVG